MLAISDFIRTYECPSTDVRNLVNEGRLKQAKENRERIKPIIESIIFLGRQNIALRGHRDDGQIFEINQNSSLTNDGNLRELLRFRVSAGDNILKNHLNNGNSKATYISKSIQKEIIELCAQQIQDLIKTRIFKEKFYSVIFDETTDTSHSSQMTVVLRYIDVNTCEIREDFIGFVNCHTENYSNFTYEPVLTGELLGNTVANTLTKFGFNLKDCIGIGTDGCSLMLSENNGAVTKLQKILPNAIKSPCYNHALNLSVSKCSSVRAVRNTIGTMKEVISFFKGSPKRSNVLKYINKGMLTSLCKTRWIERHDSVLSFKSCLTSIVETLDLI
ncbi:52 kDa repressor of the inhibitor of the protein kinase-like [Hydra vulgaris]|uniref:52 kDa repressor of the inhibitor of the protein kinase-like n=1 Tax=Hydra vulgaris TaxID=6087 RepID=UPI0032EA63F4